MHTIYDLGYQTVKDPEVFLRAVAAIDAVVIDVRFSPYSRNPAWNKLSLQRKLVERYVHVAELGNINYRDWSAEIEIKDLAGGLRYVEHHLQHNDIILLCACKDRETCHRKLIADACAETLGLASIPLDNNSCAHLAAGLPFDPQPRLF